MIRSVYEAASAMMAQMARQLTIGANLANVSTPGYKEEISSLDDFQQMFLNRYAEGETRQLGSLSTAVGMDQSAINFSQGTLAETGREFDIAISGDGFLAAQTPDGVEYTRNGSLRLDATGQLVTSDGLPVLGEQGPLTLPLGETWFDPDGTIRVDGQTVGKLQLVAIDPAAVVTPTDNSRYRVDGATTPSTTAGVSQGFLEQSNVDATQAMVDSLAATRSYQMAQQMLQMSDDTLGLAVNDLGKVNL